MTHHIDFKDLGLSGTELHNEVIALRTYWFERGDNLFESSTCNAAIEGYHSPDGETLYAYAVIGDEVVCNIWATVAPFSMYVTVNGLLHYVYLMDLDAFGHTVRCTQVETPSGEAVRTLDTQGVTGMDTLIKDELIVAHNGKGVNLKAGGNITVDDVANLVDVPEGATVTVVTPDNEWIAVLKGVTHTNCLGGIGIIPTKLLSRGHKPSITARGNIKVGGWAYTSHSGVGALATTLAHKEELPANLQEWVALEA